MADVSDRWTRVQTLFEHALDRPEDERSAWLRAQCGGDPDLYREVDALLSGDRARHPMFAGHAADLLTGDELADLLPTREGERVGAWTLGEMLGEGGMGTVYRAERAEADGPEGFRQSAALKLVKPGMDSAAVLARFHAERRILARLQHPGIARLLDGGLTEAGRPFFAMELVEGEPITSASDARALSIDARLALFTRACEAVRYAHQQLVVHRDLKPSNLLVVETPEGLRPVLLDFGIARLLEDDDAGDLTRTGHRVLTPAYAAPEQVRGEPPTTATDVYALGGLLYRLLCGAPPIPPASRPRHEAEQAILSETPPRPSARVTAEAARQRGTTEAALARRLRGDLDTICLKALRKEPGERYGSAAELLADVQRFRDGLPIEARPASRAYRVRKFVARHRAGVLGTTTALVALITLSGFYTVRLAGERDRAELEAAKANEISGFLSEVFQNADPDVTGADSVLVVDVLERGAASIREDLADRPDLQAPLMRVIGAVFLQYERYDEALALLNDAVGLFAAMPDPDPVEYAEAARVLGNVQYFTDDISAADSSFRLAIRTITDAAGRDDPRTANILRSLANYETFNGRFESAEALLHRALAIHESRLGPDALETGRTISSLVFAANSSGRPREADALSERALRILRAHLPPTNSEISDELVMAGSIKRELGDYDAAAELLHDALDSKRAQYGNDHVEVAYAMNNLSGVYREMEQLDEAERLAREALRIRQGALGPTHVEVTHSHLGSILRDQGRHEEAARALQTAIPLLEAALGPGRRVGRTQIVLGQTQADLGQADAAEASMREGIAMLRDAMPDSGPDLATATHALGEFLEARAPREARQLAQESEQLCLGAAEPDPECAQRARELLNRL